MRVAPAALLLASLSVLPAQGGADDPLKSPACGRSIAALEAARTGPAGAAAVEGLRRQATQDCLGGSGARTRPSPTTQPPVSVAPPVVDVPQPPPAPVAAPPPPPPVDIERPAVITSCDAAGCWTSDGVRLNRSGPLLLGPGGACVTSGHVVRCP
ncbi:hypothetical protein [Ramlibacter sp.]|uniref:hypothetical protein n=1 Tax=Ramlibacter sp. TaxID=1917967 RepID=UPI002D31823A|nr:hypothetical protein [Ramlibacter sp.]HYD74417.1 hypothetical protein [Ramlibacter sp.]